MRPQRSSRAGGVGLPVRQSVQFSGKALILIVAACALVGCNFSHALEYSTELSERLYPVGTSRVAVHQMYEDQEVHHSTFHFLQPQEIGPDAPPPEGKDEVRAVETLRLTAREIAPEAVLVDRVHRVTGVGGYLVVMNDLVFYDSDERVLGVRSSYMDSVWTGGGGRIPPLPPGPTQPDP